MTTFMDLCLRGEATPADVDRFIARWHGLRDKGPQPPLHEFLGMAWGEYCEFVIDGDRLAAIIEARRGGGHMNDASPTVLSHADHRRPATERPKDDHYPTPDLATRALLSVESFHGPRHSDFDIWEPACGDGAMALEMMRHGYAVVGTTLIDYGFGEAGRDFLMERKRLARNIVTNPPFRIAQQFVEHALAFDVDKAAFFLRLAFLESMKRRALFDRRPPARVWVFSPRLTVTHAGYNPETMGRGTMAFMWCVWDRAHRGPTQLGWIP